MVFFPSLQRLAAPGDFFLARKSDVVEAGPAYHSAVCCIRIVDAKKHGPTNIHPLHAEQHQMLLMSNMEELCQSWERSWINVTDVLGLALVFHANTIDSVYDCIGIENAFFTCYQLTCEGNATIVPVEVTAVEHQSFGRLKLESFPESGWYSVYGISEENMVQNNTAPSSV